MLKKLTITVDSEVYEGLHKIIGRRNISKFLTNLARPYVSKKSLEDGYKKMAADDNGEKEALDWSENLINDSNED